MHGLIVGAGLPQASEDVGAGAGRSEMPCGQWGLVDTPTYCVPSGPCALPISTLVPFEAESLGMKETSGSWEADTSHKTPSADFPVLSTGEMSSELTGLTAAAGNGCLPHVLGVQ